MVKLSTILAELLSEAENPNVYKFRGILITDTENRGQTEILSDIRSIAGVTVATSKELPTSGDVTGAKFYKTELKEQGMANINDTVQTFQKRITSIENSATALNDFYVIYEKQRETDLPF